MASPHLDDPYYCVALVFTLFMCDRCREYLLGDAQSGESYGPGDDWYHRFGEFARRAGWHAETVSVPNDSTKWLVLCPTCVAKPSHAEPGTASDSGA